MTRLQIKNRFRQENPEISTNVISDTVLDSWLLEGNINAATTARLIKGDNVASNIESVVSQAQYDLSTITKFYDIDELPGGGVAYNDKRLTVTTIAELDETRPSWRTASAGTPKRYYRRNQYIYLEPKPDTANLDIDIYSVNLPDDFDDDAKTPFNQLTHLAPFHYSLVLYLQWRAKAKLAKPEERDNAIEIYDKYITWMKNEVDRNIYHAIQFKPSSGYLPTSGMRRPR